jgi:hypothetical protein
MGELVNYNSVVVNLEPTENGQTNVQTATYEQAFLGEEQSNAKGRGRARRKTRKLERIGNKREVRTERRKLKGDRQEERIERRGTRKGSRQDIRGEQQDARMQRRNKRRDAKQNSEEDTNAEVGDEEEIDTQQDGGQDSDSSTDTGYNDSQDTSTSGGGYDDSEDDEDSSGSSYGEDEEDSTYEDEEDTYGEAEENFYGDSSNFASEVTGKPSVPMAIQTICYQIEMNNEMISQLLQHKKMMEAKGKDTSKVTDTLGQKYDKVQNLEAKLENFAGADGNVDRQKAKAVRIAKGKARKQRIENLPIPPIILYKLLKKGVSKDKIKQWWESKGRADMSSKMNFEGGVDDFGITNNNLYVDYDELGLPAYDYDQPQPQIVDLDSSNNDPMMNFSGADGSSSNSFWKSLLIGGVIAFAGIYIIRKYKLLK